MSYEPGRFYEVVSVPQDLQDRAIELYAQSGSFTLTAQQLQLSKVQVRRIIKSPTGSFAFEQLMRDRARTRAIRLASLTDRTIDELEIALTNGNERVLNSRREGEPFTVFLRPDIKDLTGCLAWLSQHARDVADQLTGSIDVHAHDVSFEARSANLANLKELVSVEERRLQLDGVRDHQDSLSIAQLQGSNGERHAAMRSVDAALVEHGTPSVVTVAESSADTETSPVPPGRTPNHPPPQNAREAEHETGEPGGTWAERETDGATVKADSNEAVDWEDLL